MHSFQVVESKWRETRRKENMITARKLNVSSFFLYQETQSLTSTKQDSFPARFGGVHFVNQPWYIHALYTLIKPFLKDKTRKRIFLHGNNLNSLHQLIHPEFLPSEFGGTLPPYDMGTWARTLLGPDYSDENDYTHTSYNAMHVKHTSSNLERECSPKPMKSVEPGGCMEEREGGVQWIAAKARADSECSM
ncbi:Retinaldehyde-binding protein 1-like protein 1 [Heterocephalus glaber]|uniref:Retinaldehyde-binding protein 1-like protein 1 n=1 Tax=Heterocephalus glaber TaxID=10181 RepID=G5C4V5_HETGA|nr:Retinaldehyde-binding protein 1-like protein 1 [Heterocephalus glaber]